MAIDPMTAGTIASIAAPIVEDAVKVATAYAESLINKVFDFIQCEIIDGPTLCRKKKARELYRLTMGRLVEESQIAADNGDWISAYAIAKAASELSQQAGFLGDLDPVTLAEWDSVADSLADLYSDKAKADLDMGKKPRHRVQGATSIWPIIIGGGLLLAAAGGGALFGRGRKRDA
jgi:hypothetical protein